MAHGVVVVIQVEIGVAEPFFVGNIRFCPDGDAAHSLNRLHRILSRGGLAGEHDGAGTVVNSVGHIGNFGSSGTGFGGHGLQHFRGGDDKLAPFQAELDELLLDRGQLFIRNLHTQVPTGHHDAVAVVQNGVGVVHTGAVFDLGDDVDLLPAVLIQKCP